MRAGIHCQPAADGTGDALHEGQSAEPSLGQPLEQTAAGHRTAGAYRAAGGDGDFPEGLPGEPDNGTAHAEIAHQYVGAAAQQAARQAEFTAQPQHIRQCLLGGHLGQYVGASADP